jgi:hypothetical protein
VAVWRRRRFGTGRRALAPERKRALLHSDTHRERATLFPSTTHSEPTKCNAPGVCSALVKCARWKIDIVGVLGVENIHRRTGPRECVDYVRANVKPLTWPRRCKCRAPSGRPVAAGREIGGRAAMLLGAQHDAALSSRARLMQHMDRARGDCLVSEQWHPATPA